MYSTADQESHQNGGCRDSGTDKTLGIAICFYARSPWLVRASLSPRRRMGSAGWNGGLEIVGQGGVDPAHAGEGIETGFPSFSGGPSVSWTYGRGIGVNSVYGGRQGRTVTSFRPPPNWYDQLALPGRFLVKVCGSDKNLLFR
jgi:hypothetical protein